MVHVYILLVLVGIKVVLQVDMVPRAVLPVFYLGVVRNRVVLVQRIKVYRILILLLYLHMLR